ncbi:MAG TPA: hypothetical protein VHM24_04170 [Gemmatimonadaceae bacterium]|nr:hypothetical protein [Gemmatimonadaceae bacterium]
MAATGRNVSAEMFTLYSAVAGIALAALLAQTRVFAFASFQVMALCLLAADVCLYVLMKAGIIRTPGSRRE